VKSGSLPDILVPAAEAAEAAVAPAALLLLLLLLSGAANNGDSDHSGAVPRAQQDSRTTD
jgi:hypothetical protein